MSDNSSTTKSSAPTPPVQLGDFISATTKRLADAGIKTGRLDCLILLEDTLGLGRAHILAHPDMQLTEADCTSLNKKVVQREQHRPLAYIRGKASFYGREFAVNNNVLVPRPETEALIDLAKKIDAGPLKIADIGTGSGCIGITAGLELSSLLVDCYDIDQKALTVAKQNAEKLQAHNTTFYNADLFSRPHNAYDLVFANLPYVPENYPINRAASYEPRAALFSGADGLDHYRSFWRQVAAATIKPVHIITEALPEQHPSLEAMALSASYSPATQPYGFAQHFFLSPKTTLEAQQSA